MEKYGVSRVTFEVVVKEASGEFRKIASNLSLSDADELQKNNPGAIVRPE